MADGPSPQNIMNIVSKAVPNPLELIGQQNTPSVSAPPAPSADMFHGRDAMLPTPSTEPIVPNFDPQSLIVPQNGTISPRQDVEPQKEPITPSADPIKDPLDTISQTISDDAPTNTEEVKTEPQTPQTEEPSDDFDNIVNPVPQQFKTLRSKYKETKQLVENKDKELQEARQALAKYESGEIVPETLKSLQARVDELEPLEEIHRLKTSKAYQERFIKPLTELEGQLERYAKDYEIPVETLKQALTLENEAHLNRFVSHHFDDVGAIEVKGILKKMRGLHEEAREAEVKPVTALASIEAENKQIFAIRDTQRREAIITNAQDAWKSALYDIYKEGVVKELIPDKKNERHNKEIVTPLQDAAAKEFGRTIRELGELGIEALPEGTAKALARAYLLAHASAVSIHVREAALQHAEGIKRNAIRTSHMTRPQVGGRVAASGGGSAEPRKLLTPDQAGADVLQSVMGSQVLRR